MARFIWGFARQEKKKIVIIFLFVIASQVFSLLEPWFFSRIVDNFLRDVGKADFTMSSRDFITT